MTGAEALLDEAGVALWLTDWKIDIPTSWTPRRLMALVGGEMAGRLDFLVHPDGQAVSVWGLEVEPELRRRKLASVMMDALYAAHPTAWIDHGGRALDVALWWDRYTDPAPERNIHNQPPTAGWAQYFDPLDVARQRARNAYQNWYYGLDGHRAAEYRYGERLEEEALRMRPVFREAAARGPNPAVQELHSGLRLVLSPSVHRLVHDNRLDSEVRAEMLLDQIGHGSLPHAGWNTTQRAAFEDMAHEQALFPDPKFPEPADMVTHVAFRVRLPTEHEVPHHDAKSTWVTYHNSPGIEVNLTGMSWRTPQTPWITHEADFSPPIDAAIAPAFPNTPSSRYAARFDDVGQLLPGHSPRRPSSDHPLAGREAEIAKLATWLRDASHQRRHGFAQSPHQRKVSESPQPHRQSPSLPQEDLSRQQGPRQG